MHPATQSVIKQHPAAPRSSTSAVVIINTAIILSSSPYAKSGVVVQQSSSSMNTTCPYLPRRAIAANKWGAVCERVAATRTLEHTHDGGRQRAVVDGAQEQRVVEQHPHEAAHDQLGPEPGGAMQRHARRDGRPRAPPLWRVSCHGSKTCQSATSQPIMVIAIMIAMMLMMMLCPEIVMIMIAMIMVMVMLLLLLACASCVPPP